MLYLTFFSQLNYKINKNTRLLILVFLFNIFFYSLLSYIEDKLLFDSTTFEIICL